MSFYIYYDKDTGSIRGLTNELNQSLGENYIDTDFETYNKFSDGIYKFHEWGVFSSPKNEEVTQLVKKVQEEKEFDPDKSIKQIKKVLQATENAFLITQDTKNSKWNITTTLDDKHLIYYSQTSGYANQKKQIFVIKEDDPTLLLDSFYIEFKDLLTNNEYDVKVYNKDIAKRSDISLICSRVDEEYLHIVR